jgi:hypothetical protein
VCGRLERRFERGHNGSHRCIARYANWAARICHRAPIRRGQATAARLRYCPLSVDPATFDVRVLACTQNVD